MSRRIQLGTTLGCICVATACSTTTITPDTGSTETGGASNPSTIGGQSSVGGARASGGMSSSVGGTSSASGGASSVAGQTGTGGSSSVTAAGGTGLGGSQPGSGGSIAVVGGTTSSGGVVSTGGNPITGGGTSSPLPTGGTVAVGGSSSVGGAKTGGAPGAGGTVFTATGGAVTTTTGGAVATGGAKTGGAPAIGGAAPTGGTPATGGAAPTGGAPATGGSAALVCAGSTTKCGNTCVTLATDKDNCGACGYSCLGGTCAASLCQATVLGNEPNIVDNTDPARVFYLDDTYVYYNSSGVNNVRESKTDSQGSGTVVVTGGYFNRFSVIGSKLYWNLNSTVKSCNPSSCSATQSDLTATGYIVTNSAPAGRVVLENDACAYSSSFCLDWLNVDETRFYEYEDYHTPPAGGYSTYTSFMAAGNTAFWIASDYNASSAFTKAALLFAASDSSRGQLAGSLPDGMVILDVNDYSVVLANTSGDLYRVPLPLGLGTDAPQAIGQNGVAATEDASRYFWIDPQGTVYSCSKSNCASTKVTRANGQSKALRILQDSAAVYWGRAFPSQVMRMAK